MKNSTFYADVLDARASVIDSLSTATYSASASYQYDAYGNRVGSSAGTAAVSPYGYDGYYTDSESGLCYLNARYYDPSTQCFTQEDTYWGTVGDPGSRNLYDYCQDNPVNRADYNGHYSPADDGTGRSVEYVGTDNKKVVNPGNKNVTVTVNENATVKQLNTYLGVRATKNDNAPEIGSINSGEGLQVLSDDGYFAYVRYHIKASPYYKEGYVHSRYLDKGGATKAAAKPAVKAKAASAKSKTNTKATSKATAVATNRSNNSKDTHETDDWEFANKWITAMKTAWSSLGAVAGVSGAGAGVMAGSGAVWTTTVSLGETWSDPNLTTQQQEALSFLEIAFAFTGVVIAVALPESVILGLAVTIGYAAVQYIITEKATDACHKENGGG